MRRVCSSSPQDTVAESKDVEVDEQPDLHVSKTQVRKALRLVDRIDPIDRLEFHDDLIGDQQVDAVPGVDSEPSIRDRQSQLTLDVDLARREFVGQTRFVRRLEQPWAERSVNLNGCPDDLTGQLLAHQHGHAFHTP